VLLLLLGALLLPILVFLPLFLCALLLLVFRIGLLSVLVLLGLRFLFRFVLFFVLLILLWVSKGSGSKKHKQNCCADDSNAFHECCLDTSLSAARMINCLLLTKGPMASSCARRG